MSNWRDAVTAADPDVWSRTGEAVSYTPPGGALSTIQVIWNVDVIVERVSDSVEAVGERPRMDVLLTDVDPAVGAIVVRKGRRYQLTHAQKDGARASARCALDDIGAA